MAWAFRNAGNVTRSFGAAITPAAPAVIQQNDLMLIAASETLGSAARPAVSGWNDITLGVNWSTGAAVYARIATAGDASNPSAAMPSIPSWSSSDFQLAVCLVYSGGPTTLTGILDPSCTDTNYNSTNQVRFTGMIAPVNNGSLFVAIGFKNTLGNGTPALSETGGLVGFNRRILDWPTNARPIIVIDDLVQNTAAGLSAPGMNMNFSESSTQAGHSTILIFVPAAVASLPPGDEIWPDNFAAQSRHASLHQFWQIPLELATIVPPLPPIRNFETYLPPRADYRALRSQELNLLESTLFGQDRVLTPVDWAYGWDPPQLPAALRGDSYPLTATEMFALANLPPYLEYSWPAPPGPRQTQKGFEFSINLNLLGKDKVLTAGIQNIMWDPPLGPRRPVENLSFNSAGLSLFFFTPVKPPLSVSDWPVPPAPRRFVQDFVQGMPGTILGYLTTYQPFQGLQDLPPRRISLQIANLTYEWSRTALLKGQDIIPFGTSSTDTQLRAVAKPDLYSINETSQFLIPVTPPIPPGLGVKHMGRVVLDPASVGEAVIVPFDFISGLQAGEVIVSASTKCTLYSGTDSNPQAVVSGVATVGGTIAFQTVVPTITGNIYDLACTAVTSFGQILTLEGYFAIIPGLP